MHSGGRCRSEAQIAKYCATCPIGTVSKKDGVCTCRHSKERQGLQITRPNTMCNEASIERSIDRQ